MPRPTGSDKRHARQDARHFERFCNLAAGSFAAVELFQQTTAPGVPDPYTAVTRIISNDWQAALLAKLVARNLERARAVLDHLDFSPGAVRADLEADRSYPPLLHSACELIDHASDLAAESAWLVHANERRWRVFRERVEQLAASEAGE